MKLKLTYIILIIIAITCGYFVGQQAVLSTEAVVRWMGQPLNFGFDPVHINLKVIVIDLGLHFSINFLEVVFSIFAAMIAPKVAAAIK